MTAVYTECPTSPNVTSLLKKFLFAWLYLRYTDTFCSSPFFLGLGRKHEACAIQYCHSKYSDFCLL